MNFSKYDSLSAAAAEVKKEIDNLQKSFDVTKPVAWMNPCIISFNGATSTNCPKDLQIAVEGTVAWSPELLGDGPSVIDRNGVTHSPRGLIYADENQPDPVMCSFYDVKTYKELVAAMSDHIDRLIEKLPKPKPVQYFPPNGGRSG